MLHICCVAQPETCVPSTDKCIIALATWALNRKAWAGIRLKSGIQDALLVQHDVKAHPMWMT